MKHLNLFNNFRINEGHFDSSITKQEAESIINQIQQYEEVLSGVDWDNLLPSTVKRNTSMEDIEKQCKDRLYIYDKINQDFVINTIFNQPNISTDDIIRMGDEIMEKYGTEPHMVLQAFEDCFSVFTANGIYTSDDEDETIEEKVKAQRYKGHKIPGKYLAGPQPGKMKKEIDKFRGKKEYKKDWDADYSSGKGGVGKRVKTKKSASTKAYHRMFGESKINEGIISWVVGSFIALKVIKFIIRLISNYREYRTLAKNLLMSTKMNAGVRYGTIDNTGRKSEPIDALKVAEYNDRYFLTFSGPFMHIKNLRVLKDQKMLLIDYKDEMVKVPLSEKEYNEFIEIIKEKIED